MVRLHTILIIILSFTIIQFCTNNSKDNSKVNKSLFGKLSNGSKVFQYILKNKNGMVVKIIEYGAAIVSISVGDKSSKFEDVVLGYDKLEDYVNDKSYLGAIVGRYGNRIKRGKFKLEGKDHQLTINEGENHLHGGKCGYNKVLWKGEVLKANDTTHSIKFSYEDPNGREGYPGTVNISVIYTLTEKDELKIEYSAVTDKPTILNPTHHSYFNLSGNFQNSILDHELMINADYFTVIDAGLIPTGELAKVEKTPMDFRTPTRIGERIDNDFEQLTFGKGYDHNWVIKDFDGKVKKIASIYEPISGRIMEVLSDQPGLQFYSGNFLDGTTTGKKGEKYNYRTGLCLETQLFPDSPNKSNFPNPRLNPGETYSQTTIYRFSIK